MNEEQEMKYAEMFSRWYSWGSPVGLGILVACLALAGLFATVAVERLTAAGSAGVQIEQGRAAGACPCPAERRPGGTR